MGQTEDLRMGHHPNPPDGHGFLAGRQALPFAASCGSDGHPGRWAGRQHPAVL